MQPPSVNNTGVSSSTNVVDNYQQQSIQQSLQPTIATLVRNWLHYDNLATSLYRQHINARKLRNTYEKNIIGQLHSNHMENAIIQINNGKITLIEEKHPKTLTISRIEELLHSYYSRKGGINETKAIMNHILGNRGTDSIKRLKKTSGTAPLASPLPLPPPM